MTVFTEVARAKINLTLRVHGRRPDGYHELESLVAFADIGDQLALTDAAPAGCNVTGPFAAAIDGGNLVLDAIAAVRNAAPEARLGRIALEKTLPVAAGVGGGSADAAATLRLLRRANPGIADLIDWPGIAASLGADVAVCFANQPAIMRGRGERLTPLARLPVLAAVLVNPCTAVPPRKTAAVFAALAVPPLTGPAVPDFDCSNGAGVADAGELLGLILDHHNDLEAAAMHVMPAIATVRAELAGAGDAQLVRLAGAGPTCFALYRDAATAVAAAARIARRQPHWWVAATRIG